MGVADLTGDEACMELTQEQEQAIFAKMDSLSDDMSGDAEKVSDKPNTESTTVAGDSTSADPKAGGQPEEKKESEAPKTQEPQKDDGHPVPYKRFSQVVRARNSVQAENERLRQQLAQYTNRPSAPVVDGTRGTRTPEDARIDELLGIEEPQSEAPDPVQAIRVELESIKLDRELDQVSREYPDVPRDFVLQAVAQNPRLSVRAIAEQYTTYRAGIEEQAIARYLQKNPSASVSTAPTPAPQAPLAAPRPPSRTATPSSATPAHERPKTMEDAETRALRKLDSLFG